MRSESAQVYRTSSTDDFTEWLSSVDNLYRRAFGMNATDIPLHTLEGMYSDGLTVQQVIQVLRESEYLVRKLWVEG